MDSEENMNDGNPIGNQSNHNFNSVNSKTPVNKDSSLLMLDKKLESAGGVENIVQGKFLMKPEIKKINKSSFLNQDRLDFLNMFKNSTTELINDHQKKAFANIEEPISMNTQNSNIPNNAISNQGPSNEKFIQMNLKLGVLDILPKGNGNNNNIQGLNCNESVASTTITSSDTQELIQGNPFLISNQQQKKSNVNINLNLREEKGFNNGEGNMEFTQNEQMDMISNDDLLKLMEDSDSEGKKVNKTQKRRKKHVHKH
mmetsp:Transcript_7549/g.7770  ORF Transcript_7549/g.7770 Transcript_7549/m.7770 type:complete len:257 (-) Transcript_7549:71-841(-)